MASTHLERAGQLEKQLRDIVRQLRYGSRNRSLLFIALSGLALATWLWSFEGFPGWIKPLIPGLTYALLIAGISLLFLATWRIWRSVVAPPPVDTSKPSAIKGAAAFGSQDAELFLRLGRNEELARLRGWILDDQTPIVALSGESGVGKTSLLRAGLSGALRNDGVLVVYWEALPTNPEEGLLYAIRAKLARHDNAPHNLHDLLEPLDPGSRLVVVIDQAEQLSTDGARPIFDLLRLAATSHPPFSVTWIVAFRRDYTPDWHDFELELSPHSRLIVQTLVLKKFSLTAAERVFATLLEASELEVDIQVIKHLVRGLSDQGKVSPVDIGVGLLVLSEWASQGSSPAYTNRTFQKVGGQAGLLTDYLIGLLEKYQEGERKEIYRALLEMVDLESNQRIAEGRSVRELLLSVKPGSELRLCASLDFLASPKARVLESIPGASSDENRYRLTHEKLIPALRKLTGTLLAEVEQANLTLNRAFRAWLPEREPKLLLARADLRTVIRYQGHLPLGDDAAEKREFLQLSRRRLMRRRIVAGLFLGVLTISAIEALNLIQARVARERLASWGLPGDLYDYQGQLEDLVMLAPINRLDWLDERSSKISLKSLSLADIKIDRLEDLPTTITQLKVVFQGGEDIYLGALPLDLRNLAIDVRDSRITHGLAENSFVNLASLHIAGDCWYMDDFVNAALRATTTSLSDLTLECVDSGGSLDIDPALLPRSLKRLTLMGLNLESWAKRWKNLPIGLQELSLQSSKGNFGSPADWHWAEISRNLMAFSFEGEKPGIVKDLPKGLVSLKLDYKSPYKLNLRELPPGLEKLIYRGPHALEIDALPKHLRSLDLNYADVDIPVNALEAQVESLSDGITDLGLVFIGPDFPEIKSWPEELKTLRVKILFSFTPRTQVRGLPRVERLEINSLISKDVQALPRSLRSLEVRALIGPEFLPPLDLPPDISELVLGCRDKGFDLAKLPKSLRALTIFVPEELEVSKLPRDLKVLDLTGSKVYSLEGLPENLQKLTVSARNLKSLKGLPPSVRSLHLQ